MENILSEIPRMMDEHLVTLLACVILIALFIRIVRDIIKDITE